ncbi:MAG: hypothetical protein M1823_004448 [Watsoniomyces obsoletus]|nr:MAG: hypothetical protein M1823_004448 [Watsoniomyces obsoletus]
MQPSNGTPGVQCIGSAMRDARAQSLKPSLENGSIRWEEMRAQNARTPHGCRTATHSNNIQIPQLQLRYGNVLALLKPTEEDEPPPPPPPPPPATSSSGIPRSSSVPPTTSTSSSAAAAAATAKRSQPPHPSETPAKKQSKWSAEEDALIIELRGRSMKWEDISKRLPGRSAISCRLHYQNYLERRSEWDDDRKNKLARLYERFKAEMWSKIAEEMSIPWRAAEAMHWQLGEQDMARRAGVVPFSLSSTALEMPAKGRRGSAASSRSRREASSRPPAARLSSVTESDLPALSYPPPFEAEGTQPPPPPPPPLETFSTPFETEVPTQFRAYAPPAAEAPAPGPTPTYSPLGESPGPGPVPIPGRPPRPPDPPRET